MRPVSALLLSSASWASALKPQCSRAPINEGGNFFCDRVGHILYKGLTGHGHYDDVTAMPSTGECGYVRKPYHGPLAPLDQDLSIHIRGPFHLAEAAVYTPSPARRPSVAARHAHGRRHRHPHPRRVEKRENAVTELIYSTVLTWVDDDSGPAAAEPTAAPPSLPAPPPDAHPIRLPPHAPRPPGAPAAAPQAPEMTPDAQVARDPRPAASMQEELFVTTYTVTVFESQPAASVLQEPPLATPPPQTSVAGEEPPKDEAVAGKPSPKDEPVAGGKPPPKAELFGGEESPKGQDVEAKTPPEVKAGYGEALHPHQASSASPGGRWDRVAYYNAESQAVENMVFMGNYGGQGSGVFDHVYGNSLAYLGADGSRGAASPETLANVTIPSNKEFSIFSAERCDESCGFSRAGEIAYKGFGSANKVFVFRFSMPHDGDARGFNADMPALWLLNARIPRTAQYHACSCWRSRCGEADVFEVLAPGDDKCKSTLHVAGGAGSSDWFRRPVDGAVVAVVLHGRSASLSIRVLPADTDLAGSLDDETVLAWLCDEHSTEKSSLFQLG